MSLLEVIQTWCRQAPAAPMVEVMGTGLARKRSYQRGEIWQAVNTLAHVLQGEAGTPARPLKVGLVMKNSPEWVVADLALMLAGQVEVPVPLAFAAEQALYLLEGADVCLVDAQGQARLREWLAQAPAGTQVPEVRLIDVDELLSQPVVPALPIVAVPDDHVCKVIHTSGTTSRPKGVRIRTAGLSALLDSLRRRITPGHYRRYLSLVPLSLLIEQVTAAYMTFLEGGTLIFLHPGKPLLGESGATTKAMLEALPLAGPTALTLPPAMVEALLAACRAVPDEPVRTRCRRLFGQDAPAFIACGGAPTAPAVLAELWEAGIPVYEGYGLSENSSVVAWNAPTSFKAGTVGQPLDHVQVRLSEDNELLIKSASLFAGYAGSDPSSCEVDAEGWLHTGDIAAIDDEGFLRVYGRKKNVIITANGRNVSPEWVESRYKSLDCVEQAVIFGDGLESLHGYFVISPDVSLKEAKAQIKAFGLSHLSDVERVDQVVAATASAQLYQTCFTVTGRPRRDVIWAQVQPQSNSKVREEHHA